MIILSLILLWDQPISLIILRQFLRELASSQLDKTMKKRKCCVFAVHMLDRAAIRFDLIECQSICSDSFFSEGLQMLPTFIGCSYSDDISFYFVEGLLGVLSSLDYICLLRCQSPC